MNVAILPVQKDLFNNNIFDLRSSRDNSLERFVLLKQALEHDGHVCKTIDKFEQHEPLDFLIFSRFDKQAKAVFNVIKDNPSVRLLYMANEPSLVCPLHKPEILVDLPFDSVLTWNDDAVTMCGHILKSNIGQPVIDKNAIPRVSFDNKRLCCMVASGKTSNREGELYSERLNAIKYFSDNGVDFSLYGINWEYIDKQYVKNVYKGPVESKIDCMKDYKFSICYENTKDEAGLITEKIFDSFAAGCIPIYRGASNVEKYIPRDCYIDFREFNSYDALLDYMITMSEEEYNSYLEMTEKFLETQAYREFTSVSYVEKISGVVNSGFQNRLKRKLPNYKAKIAIHILRNMEYYLCNISRMRRFFYDYATTW